jgi:DNA repair protein RadC
MRMTDIPSENRPRERMAKYGPDALSDAEILALLLKNGTVGENVTDMSNRLIQRYGIERLSKLSLEELQEIRGIGPAKAMQIAAAFQLDKRCRMAEYEKTPVKTARDVYEYAKPLLAEKEKEHIMVMYLDTKNRINKHETVSMGTLNSSLIHPREIFKTAIKENTNAIIVAHNHPSGDPTPSKDDRDITKELYAAGELLEIQMLDHVIIGKDNYYSFKERNQL